MPGVARNAKREARDAKHERCHVVRGVRGLRPRPHPRPTCILLHSTLYPLHSLVCVTPMVHAIRPQAHTNPNRFPPTAAPHARPALTGGESAIWTFDAATKALTGASPPSPRSLRPVRIGHD